MTDTTRPAVLDLIDNTPMVPVTRFDTGKCTLLLKLESRNPGDSIKDSVGVAMIEAAERDGRPRAGGKVVEATAGNTGLGLALVARAKGYRVVLVVPDKMSPEKVLHLKALGAEVHSTRSDVGKGHPDYDQDIAARLAREIPGAFFADQINNPANPLAHETGTAPEVRAEAPAHIVRIDAFDFGPAVVVLDPCGVAPDRGRRGREHRPDVTQDRAHEALRVERLADEVVHARSPQAGLRGGESLHQINSSGILESWMNKSSSYPSLHWRSRCASRYFVRSSSRATRA